MEKIKFIPDGEEEAAEFFVLEQTRLQGVNYLLVTESAEETEDADAYILKDLSADEDTEAIYEFVDDDEELRTVSEIFEKLMDGVGFEIEESNSNQRTVKEVLVWQ